MSFGPRPPPIPVGFVSASTPLRPTAPPRDERRDRFEKIQEYARFGIRFYWLVDPQQRTIEIYEQGADQVYSRRVLAGSGSLNDVPGCPGLTLDLDAMWSKIDALENH